MDPEAIVVDLEEPPQKILDWAKENIGENPETKCQVICELRDLIFERGDVVPHRTDDEFLLRFLRARYFKVENAYKLFVRYHDFKENNPELCQNIDLAQLKKIGADKVIQGPPYREQTGRRILYYRMGLWDPQKHSIEEMFQVTVSLLEMAAMEPQAQILGGICCFDLKDLTIQQALYMTPSIAHKMVQLMMTSFPLRIHAIHIINQSYVFDIVYTIFKPFLNPAMKEKVFFHGEDLESLHHHIYPKHLPEIYGGVQPDYDYKISIKTAQKNEKLVSQLKALGYRDSDLGGF